MAITNQEGGLLGPVGAGDPVADALGNHLEAYRGYLKRVAGQRLGRDLSAKVGASDIVQDTFLLARRSLATYRGRTSAEWLAWLERIMKNRLATVRRHYLDTEKRRVGREVRIDPAGDDTQFGPDPALADTLGTPGARMVRHEREVALHEALGRLPDHYRRVVRLHHEEGLTFEELADRLGVSAEAARKTWGRALVRLREAIGPSHDSR